MAVACDITISFAAAGNRLAFIGSGWAQSEDKFTWSIGVESQLLLPRLDASDYTLTLDVVPFVHPPELSNQRLIVSVNDAVVGSTALCRPSLLGYRLPAALVLGRDRNVVTLQHPDAGCPKDLLDTADDRYLAFALLEARLCRNTGPVRPYTDCLPSGLMLGSIREGTVGAGNADLQRLATARTGLTIPQIALKFESLGENCEFGLFQRQCGVEPLGLLRFSSTFMRNLIRGIDEQFDGLGEPGDIETRLEGAPRREYMIHEKKFGLVYHSFVYEGQRSLWLMREQEAARLKFLRRKFMEDLAATDKIFVYKFGSSMSPEEILPLHMALARHAAATLLWVVPEERGRPAGTVEVMSPGWLKGYIDRFAPEDDAHDFSFDGWLHVCANACVLASLHRTPSPPTINDVRGDNHRHAPLKEV